MNQLCSSVSPFWSPPYVCPSLPNKALGAIWPILVKESHHQGLVCSLFAKVCAILVEFCLFFAKFCAILFEYWLTAGPCAEAAWHKRSICHLSNFQIAPTRCLIRKIKKIQMQIHKIQIQKIQIEKIGPIRCLIRKIQEPDTSSLFYKIPVEKLKLNLVESWITFDKRSPPDLQQNVIFEYKLQIKTILVLSCLAFQNYFWHKTFSRAIILSELCELVCLLMTFLLNFHEKRIFSNTFEYTTSSQKLGRCASWVRSVWRKKFGLGNLQVAKSSENTLWENTLLVKKKVFGSKKN